jgi:hypothetical protein
MFTALASDIVANEGKGIFYAKNKLAMNDYQTRFEIEVEQKKIVKQTLPNWLTDSIHDNNQI